MCMFLFSFVSAQPPFQSTAEGVGLLIDFPKFEYVKAGEQFTFHAHVFDATSGLMMDNTTTSCLFHGYYHNGSHSIEQEMSFDSNFVDFYIDIPASFVVPSKVSYIMQCNTSEVGGFISGPVVITGTGVEPTEYHGIIQIGLMLLIFMLAIAMLFASTLLPGDEVDDDKKILQVSYLKNFRFVFYTIVYLLIMSEVFIGANIALGFFTTTMFAEFLFMIFQIMFWSMIVILPLMIIKIFVGIFEDRDFKKMIERGIEVKTP